jgi:hypothetical protein
MMTRKHFEAVAAGLRMQYAAVRGAEMPEEARRSALDTLDQTTTNLARLFGNDNTRFDTQRFYTAAGYYVFERS